MEIELACFACYVSIVSVNVDVERHDIVSIM